MSTAYRWGTRVSVHRRYTQKSEFRKQGCIMPDFKGLNLLKPGQLYASDE